MAKSCNKKFNPNLEAEVLDRRADELGSQTDELEKRVKTVVQYYDNNEELTDGSNAESAQTKRMQGLMRQFRLILVQIMNHKWAFPFIKPVDAEALELYDYYEVIKQPMDLGTILNRMRAKEESSRYKNVYDICSDVRLVFTNAMKYNDPGSDVHTMAQELSSLFEKLWYPLSVKVAGEERRRVEDEIQEAKIEKLARDTDEELEELSMQLEELREEVKKRCRKMNREEKLMLMDSLGELSVEDMNKAVEMCAKYDPDLDASATTVEINLDSMNVIAQWRFYNFVENALKRKEMDQQAKMGNGSKRINRR